MDALDGMKKNQRPYSTSKFLHESGIHRYEDWYQVGRAVTLEATLIIAPHSLRGVSISGFKVLMPVYECYHTATDYCYHTLNR